MILINQLINQLVNHHYAAMIHHTAHHGPRVSRCGTCARPTTTSAVAAVSGGTGAAITGGSLGGS